MEENQKTQDPFVAAMSGAEKTTASETGGEPNAAENNAVSYAVDSGAETVVNTVAEVLKWIGIIGGVLAFFVGIVMIGEEGAVGGILIGSGIAAVLTGIISWAFLKLLVNISRNLFKIHDQLEKLNKAE